MYSLITYHPNIEIFKVIFCLLFIKGNSIKCLQTLAPKLRAYETAHLIPKLIDLSLKQDLSDSRENY